MTAPPPAHLPKALRTVALALVDRKLTGNRRLEARAFLSRRVRSTNEVEQFIKRIANLPDAARDRHPNAIISTARIAQMRADRASGMLLRDLADRYGISLASASRLCQIPTQAEVDPC